MNKCIPKIVPVVLIMAVCSIGHAGAKTSENADYEMMVSNLIEKVERAVLEDDKPDDAK